MLLGLFQWLVRRMRRMKQNELSRRAVFRHEVCRGAFGLAGSLAFRLNRAGGAEKSEPHSRPSAGQAEKGQRGFPGR